MRKSGWAVAVGLGSLALLLTACGGSSSSSGSAGSTSSPTAAGQPTAALGGIEPGDVVLIAQSSKVGYVLAEADGQVVYTYAKDTKGGAPTCTGSCAATWVPATVQNKPLVSVGDKLPGTLGTVTTASGAKQITYNGYPLYLLKGAQPLAVTGNGVGGMWHVVKLSASDIVSG